MISQEQAFCDAKQIFNPPPIFDDKEDGILCGKICPDHSLKWFRRFTLAFWRKILRVLTGEQESVSPIDAATKSSEGLNNPNGNVAVLEPPAESSETSWFVPDGVGAIEPAEIVRPELSFEARVLENMLISQFDGQDLSLPPLPRIPDAVLKQLRNRQCNFVKIAELISEDQVAAAAVLRTANSPIYGGVSKITSLPQAVTRLGINPLRTLMMHQSLRAAMFLTGKGNHELAQMFWRRSLASAFIMRGLAGFTGVDAEDALVIGLLHDVGNVIVLRVMSEEKNFGIPLPDHETFEYLCYETHQEFGELVAKEWNMAGHLQELIQNHHAYPQPNDPLRKQRLMLILTDMIGQMLGYFPPAAYNLLQARPTRDLGLTNSANFTYFLQGLPKMIEESISWF